MPIRKVKTKDAITAFKYKNKNKVYKTGPKKGERPRIVKRPAKYRNELDTHSIFELFDRGDDEKRVCFIEGTGTTLGNSAKATRVTNINFGKLLCILELLNYDIRIVAPSAWKKVYNISADKNESVALAEKLSGKSFRTNKGALRDGEAESLLLYLYGIQKLRLEEGLKGKK